MNRKEIAEQLKHVIKNQVNLIPEDYFALDEAIKELEKNCANCKHSYSEYSSRFKDQRYECMLSGNEMGDEYEATHFCTLHENKDNE